jgi:hypothetical protein
VATSSATFTRQIGGTLGTAVFLSILFSKAAENIPAAYSAARQDPNFTAALQNPQGDPVANASFIQGMKEAAAGNGAAFNTSLQDSSFVQKIDPRLAQPYLDGFSQAMSTVFLVATFILLIAFVVAFLLPHVELRESSAYNERGNDEVAAAAASRGDAPTDAPADAPVAPADAALVGATDNGSEPTSDRKRGRHRAQPGEKLH